MKVLVTGAAGFLGTHVLTLLQDSKIPFVGCDNLDPLCGGRARLFTPFYNADICNPASLRGLIDFERVTHIIHLAAYGRNLICQDFPHKAWEVNVIGTNNILEIARLNPHIERTLVCSSNITLSDQLTVYKSTKQAVEQMVAYYAQGFKVNTLALRPSNIYGQGQSKTEYQMCAFAGLDECYRQHGVFRISGDGTQTRDWVHVKDVARAFVGTLGFGEVVGKTLDICTGVQTSMNDIADMLGVGVVYTDPRPGDAHALISNPNPARDLILFDSRLDLRKHIWDAFPSVLKP